MLFTFDIVMMVIVAHFICDFILQSDKMATNKSTSFSWLTVHVNAYSAGLFFASYFILGARIEAIYWVGVNYILHWITDACTSRLTSYLWRREQRHWFFVAIGFDQVIHYACLFGTLGYLTKF